LSLPSYNNLQQNHSTTLVRKKP